MILACGGKLLGALYRFDLEKSSVYDLMEREDRLIGNTLVDANAIMAQPFTANRQVFAQRFRAPT